MENEQIRTVLNEVLEEQKENTKLLLEIKTLLNKQEEKLNNPETETDSISNSEMQQQLSSELKEIKVFLTTLPRNMRQEKRFLLFPEHNAREYYSVVLRWLLYFVVATYGYWIVRFAITKFSN
jgi:flagellar biosynthesis component FlhA